MRPRAVALLILLCCLPLRLPAQDDPRLVSALRLAQEGLGDSARRSVSALLSRTEPTDSLYPQILYTRGLMAVEPREMRTDLQRVAVEYASSNWADDALLRLVLIEYAGGQLDAAARYLERIDLDHSGSPLYPRAAYWAGRVFFDLRRPEAACRWLRQGRERVGDDLELRNQLESSPLRCAEVADTTEREPGGRPATDTVLAARPDPAPPAPPPAPAESLPAAVPAPRPADPPPPQAPARPAAQFRIQIAAVNTARAADTIAARARTGGFEAVVVREAPYYKVRVGSYATRAEAAAALPAVRARFRGTPFVVASSE